MRFYREYVMPLIDETNLIKSVEIKSSTTLSTDFFIGIGRKL
jgi:hypothetical protein